MIIGSVSGETSVLLRYTSASIRIRENLRTTVRRRGVLVLRGAKEKVSGPVLKTRTGTLRRKINNQYTETSEEISCRTGLKLAYARAHEMGLNKVVQVREHTRQVTMAFGKPIAPVTAVVRAHTMHMNLPERSFLRSTLNEQAAEIKAELVAATVKGLS